MEKKHYFVNTQALFVAIKLNGGEKIWELEEGPQPQNVKENVLAANWVVSQFGYNYPDYMMELGYRPNTRTVTKSEWRERVKSYRKFWYDQNNYDNQGGQGMNI